ncbi:MAG: oligosaccharide flippase family protein [Bacteroides sp.]|nr:oligosaccharide flippase family protein [Bacteroides sp.]
MDNRSARIGKNTFMLNIRMFVILVITLYTSRIILSTLGIVDFGIYNVVGGIVIMLSFISSSMSLSINRFLAFEIGRKNNIQLKRVFSLAVLLQFIIALVILIISETLGLWFLKTQLHIPIERMEAANWVYQFSILSFIVIVLRVPFNASIIAHENMKIYAYISIIEALLKLIVVYLLIIISFDKLKIYSFLNFFVTLSVSFFYYIYAKKKYSECSFSFYWEKTLFKSLVSYAGWSTFGNMSSVVVSQGQNILLNVFFGPLANAARGVSYQLSGAVSSFITNFYTAINPPIVKSYAENNKKYFLTLIFEGTKLTSFLMLMMSIPLILEMDFILDLWLDDVPPEAPMFCRLILINSIIYYFPTPSVIALQAAGKIAKLHLTTGSINMSNLIISFFFLRRGYNANIVFIVQICVSLVLTLVTIFLQTKQLKISIINYIKQVILPFLIILIVTTSIISFIWTQLDYGFIRLVITIISSIITVLFAGFFLGTTKDSRNKLLSYIVLKYIKR